MRAALYGTPQQQAALPSSFAAWGVLPPEMRRIFAPDTAVPGGRESDRLAEVAGSDGRARVFDSLVRPTHAQVAAYAPLLAGRHTLVAAPTGSGKTLAYALPLLWRLASSRTFASGVQRGGEEQSANANASASGKREQADLPAAAAASNADIASALDALEEEDGGTTSKSDIRTNPSAHSSMVAGGGDSGSGDSGTADGRVNESAQSAAGESNAKQQQQQRRGPGMLVLVPTRELARQVHGVLRTVGETLGLRVALVEDDSNSHSVRGAAVVVALPSRAMALAQGRKLPLENLRCLVLDEADTLLDDFAEDLLPLLRRCQPALADAYPAVRGGTAGEVARSLGPNRAVLRATEANKTSIEGGAQVVAVGATMSPGALKALRAALPNMAAVTAGQLHHPPPNLRHRFLKVRGPNAKPTALLSLVRAGDYTRMLVFCPNSATVAWASRFLAENVSCGGEVKREAEGRASA